MYYGTLNILENAGVETVLSKDLGILEGVRAASVRRDLSLFGSFGRRGCGYDVSQLKAEIAGILGLNRIWDVVLIGAGQLRGVFLHSETFKRKNFRVKKIFDNTPEFIGKKIDGIPVSDIDNLEKEIDPVTDKLAVIAMLPGVGQSVMGRRRGNRR